MQCNCAVTRREQRPGQNAAVAKEGAASQADAYGALRQMCSTLMQFVEPSFHYSAVAVTQNFIGSPHIDECDRSFQFAVSLGEFEGGELCVARVGCG